MRYLLLLLVSCATPPIHESDYVVTDRDQLGTPIGDACLQLRKLGCREGLNNRVPRTCYEVMASSAQIMLVPIDCIKSSATVSDVRECGNDNTVRIRCLQ